jgi:hypothetical protein
VAAKKTATKLLTNSTCKQITDLVYGYLNDKLRPKVKKDFQRHLRLCPDCVSFLNTYKRTIGIARSIRAEDMPFKVRKNILDFLHRQIRQAKPGE